MPDRLRKLADVLELPTFLAETFDRVLVADTDLSGRIYFDRFYHRAEAGYGHLVRRLGGSVREQLSERFTTPAVSSRCDHFAAVEVDDVLRQVTFISQTGTSSTTSEHHFLNDAGEQVATVVLVRAILDAHTGHGATIARVLAEAPDSILAKILRAGKAPSEVPA